MAQAQEEALLSRVHKLEQELEQLKRTLLQHLSTSIAPSTKKPSLFGRVGSGDVTEAMIEEARQSLFRELKDV
jgi:ribosomal protein L9